MSRVLLSWPKADTFTSNGVVPLCAGPCVEINKDFNKTIRSLVRYAESKKVGNEISSLASSNRRGGSFSIILEQFRQVVTTAIAWRNTRIKHSQIYYVQRTVEAKETDNIAKSNHSDNRYNTNLGRGAWEYEWIDVWLGDRTIEELEHGEDDANRHWKQDVSRVDCYVYLNSYRLSSTAIVYRPTVDDALANYRKAWPGLIYNTSRIPALSCILTLPCGKVALYWQNNLKCNLWLIITLWFVCIV